MTTLTALWEVSIVLCMIAAAALLVLLLARVLGARFGGRRDVARQAVLPMLLAGEAEGLQPLGGVDLKVAAALTAELAEMTRGTERDGVLARAEALGVPGLLLRRLGSKSAQKRLEAAETLALFSGHEDEARAVLNDRNPDVRLGAALALAQRGQAPDPLTLMRQLKVGKDEQSLLLVSLMRDLAEKDSEAVAGLLFERDLSYEAKVAAMDALADLGGTYAPLLAFMARESEGEVELQPRVFRALGRTGHPAGAEAIIAGLSNAEWSVRASAAEAAGKSGIADAAGRLGELLDDPQYWVRYRAGEALLRLGPRGIHVLSERVESGDEETSLIARKILAEGRAA